MRPFGISTLIVGFDQDGTPRLYQTDPSGTYSEWKVPPLRHQSSPLLFLLNLNFILKGKRYWKKFEDGTRIFRKELQGRGIQAIH